MDVQDDDIPRADDRAHNAQVGEAATREDHGGRGVGKPAPKNGR